MLLLGFHEFAFLIVRSFSTIVSRIFLLIVAMLLVTSVFYATHTAGAQFSEFCHTPE